MSWTRERPLPETPHSAVLRERAEQKRARRRERNRRTDGDRAGIVFK